MDAEDKVLDTFDAPKGTVIDDNATAVESNSTEDSTEANNEKSDEKDKAEEDAKKVADEKSGGEDEEVKIEKIKDSNNTNDGDDQTKKDPGFLGWCCSTRDGNP